MPFTKENEQALLFYVDPALISSIGAEAARKQFEKNEPGYFDAINNAFFWGLDNPDIYNISTIQDLDELHERLLQHKDFVNGRISDGPRHFGILPGITGDEGGLRESVHLQNFFLTLRSF